MNQEERDELRRLATRATPGPWGEFCESGDWWIGRCTEDGDALPEIVCDSESIDSHDTAYIAAVSPDVVLRLLDYIDDLEGALKITRERMPR